MKLISVEYSNNNDWYDIEHLPNNPRNILLFTKEGGSAEGKYENGKWFQYRWNCHVNPIAWRELPRYDCNNNI